MTAVTGKNKWLRQLGRRASALLVVLCTVLNAGPAALASAEPTTVRVGFFAFDGYHMIDAYGERSGYGYDYLQNLAQFADFSYEYVGYDKSWKEMQDMLERGEIDLLTSAQKTEDRLERFDFSDQPIGSSSTILTVKAGETRYMDGDYTRLDGIRVGMLEGNSRNDSFRAFAREQGFAYETVFFDNNKDLIAALQSGEDIDAILTSSLRKIENEWVVATFDASPFYIMVRKGDQALLDQVNRAIDLVDIYKPNLKATLYDRYYSAASGDDIAYSAAERDYISAFADSGNMVRVLLNPDRVPLSYFEDGTAKGILTDILEEVMKRTGLPYEVVLSESRAAYETALAQGDAQICFDFRYDFNKAERAGYRLTDHYLETMVSCVTRRGDRREPEIVAAVSGSDLAEEYVTRRYKTENIRFYPTVRDCVEAVLEGEADAVYLYTYTAQWYVYQDDRGRLQETLTADYTLPLSVAVSRQADPMLYTILNKAVLSLGDEEIANLVRSRTTYPVKPFTLSGYLHSHPAAVAGLAFGGVVVLTGFIFLVFQRKNRRLEREKNREFRRFITYVCKANDAVLEFDLEGQSGVSYQIRDGDIVRRQAPDVTKEDMRGKIHPEDWAGISEKLERTNVLRLAGTGGEIYFEGRWMQETGAYNWFSFTMQGMPEEGLEPGRVMLFVKNIHQAKLEETEKRRALEDALASARQAGEAKSAFLSRMSHEIRTPLNAIVGYLALMEQSLDDPERARDCLKKQEYAAGHLLDIVNDVLDIASIESGKLKIACEAFDLRALLEETAQVFRAQAERKGVAFRLRIEELPQNTVTGDRLRVSQILMNLLSNAVKFTPAGGQVELTAVRRTVIDRRAHIRIEVRDTGIGMSEAYMARLFTPFEQEEAGTARQFGGTGLGLSITRNLVMMMDGTIDVRSKPGEGTCFTVGLSFGLAAEPEPEGRAGDAPRTGPDPGGAPLRGCRILLAEDNEMNREIAEALLNAAGAQVTSAVNGQNALETFRSAPEGTFQLILMDIQMPVMDGYEAARRIRDCGHPQAKSIPMIACSADAFTEDVNKALAAGMDDHISKPIDPVKLCRIIERYL